MRLAFAVLLLLLTACASGPPLQDYGLMRATVELTDTPFFSQTRYHCGPAALATVLVDSGVATDPLALAPQIFIPGRKGALQSEMVAATRRHARVAYVLKPELDALLTEVAAGKPVLVLQNLGLDVLPQWHYAVVVGYDTEEDSLLLRSATVQRLRMSRRRFEATWSRAGRWALVAVSPAEPPATARHADWLLEASAFEELGHGDLAATAYRAATRRWPDRTLAWLALANIQYANGDLVSAEGSLREAIRLAPSAVAHNNLAHVLQVQGCIGAAEGELARARLLVDADGLVAVLARTEASIQARAAGDASVCRQAR